MGLRLTWRPFGPLLLAQCLFFFVFNGDNSVLAVFTIDRFAILPWQLAALSAAGGLTMGIMQGGLVGPLAGRFGEKRLAVAADKSAPAPLTFLAGATLEVDSDLDDQYQCPYCGFLTRLDISKAQALPGVSAVLTAEDIPGEHNHGLVIYDWPVLVGIGERVRYIGMGITQVHQMPHMLDHPANPGIVRPDDSLPGAAKPQTAERRLLLLRSADAASHQLERQGLRRGVFCLRRRFPLLDFAHALVSVSGAVLAPGEPRILKLGARDLGQ